MTYNDTIEYLYKQLPAFERQGASGYKPGLGNAIALDDWLKNPHRAYRCIHIAGTNGKGSVANLLAATLQAAGYRVGLFTSPHFIDFRERIRVNGTMISKRSVSSFVGYYLKSGPTSCHPSFFELTTAMAMDYFKKQKVDFAVIEVGLGGRLDSSNIITPMLSIITNISLDHTQFLGNTLAEVASEKAGIIKDGVPVVVGEASIREVRDVFEQTALTHHSPITVSQDSPLVESWGHNADGTLLLKTRGYGNLMCQLGGEYQVKNADTVLHAIEVLKKCGVKISCKAVEQAFAHVCQLTGFMGRWMVIDHNPTVICDAGHNAGAWQLQAHQLGNLQCNRLHMVLGFAADKDVDTILGMMPANATYYFTQAQSSRSMKASDLKALASKHGLKGECHPQVTEAYQCARSEAQPSDCIFVGGSFYVLGELFAKLK